MQEPTPAPTQQAPIDLNDVSLMLGEARINTFIAEKKIRELLKQIDEMAKEISHLNEMNAKLRNKYGELGESADIHAIRRISGGVQRPGRGFGNDVPQRPDDSTDGVDKVEPSE